MKPRSCIGHTWQLYEMATSREKNVDLLDMLEAIHPRSKKINNEFKKINS
jgi:hypothetical protein